MPLSKCFSSQAQVLRIQREIKQDPYPQESHHPVGQMMHKQGISVEEITVPLGRPQGTAVAPGGFGRRCGCTCSEVSNAPPTRPDNTPLGELGNGAV